MLMPAAVLVVILLGAIAVDRAVVFGAQRDLVATAEAAAGDGVAAGVDLEALRAGEGVRYDSVRIDRAVTAALAGTDGSVDATWRIEGTSLLVRLERRVDLVFTRGVPGTSGRVTITAVARAELRRE
ncbi:hypothetical protein BH10ACT1_BH10ACT1_00610 [soil metagenome]